MSRRLVSITLDNLGDLPHRCRRCVFWELDPVAGERACAAGGTELEKEAWVSDTLLEWGSCGYLSYVDGLAAGYVLYAPPAYVPRSLAFPTSPVGADAVLLMTARVLPEFTGGGLGRMLVQAVARDISRRGVRAIEAFGRDGDGRETGGDSDGDGRKTGGAAAPKHGAGAQHDCLLPAAYLLSVGFKTVRPHPRTPRLRLDIKSTVSWREDVEYALERLRGSMQSPVLAHS
ncbi:MAG: GNAT family N-acetyltransferase [Jatrophihabitantaceae bacterium]